MLNLKVKIVLILIIFFICLLSYTSLVFAAASEEVGTPGGSSPGLNLTNPLGDANGDISKVANNIIKAVLGLTGVLAIIAFIWGGIDWMTSAGNESRVKKGKDMMIWAIVGLMAIFGSYAILNLIFQALGV